MLVAVADAGVAPRLLSALILNVPADIVVAPVNKLVPRNVHVPSPDLIIDNLVTVGSPSTGVKEPSAEPENVRIGDVAVVVVTEPKLLKVKAPVPEESIVPPSLPTVNKRFVVTALPVYFKIPPFNIKLDEMLEDAPMLLLLPPFAKVLIEIVPPLIEVTPV
jgi:hypothetical protein